MFMLMGANECTQQSSDSIQRDQQEKILAEGTAQTGMPAIKNFRERKILKDIIEMRDQTNLTTYTYLYSDMTGKLVFVCNSIGYGIPSTTQYTNPQKTITYQGITTMPQADPNGLFSGPSNGTWVLCKDPNSSKVAPVLFEPNIVVSQFKLN
jgi:hypothetical protein